MGETASESLERAPTGVETTKRPVDVEGSKDKPDELQCGPNLPLPGSEFCLK